MPCDLIQNFECSFDKCDQAILEKTLHEMGYRVTRSGSMLYCVDQQGTSFNIGNGRLSMQNGSQSQADGLAAQIKGQFNQNAVKEAARRQGWKVVTGTDGKVKQLVRRRK